MDAGGALVEAIEPGGILEVPGREVGSLGGPSAKDAWELSLLDPTHGAAVAPVGGSLVFDSDLAQGAWVPAPGMGRAAATEGMPCSGAVGRAWGPEDVCTVEGGGIAFGSRSQLNREPNGKCCTTGNFERTSALYILIIPCLSSASILSWD